VLAELEQGGAFLSGTPTGRGYVYVFHADLSPEKSNFSRHALWVPTWLRFAERARATPVNAATLGRGDVWQLPLERPLTEDPVRLVPMESEGGALLPAFAQIRGVLEVELPPELRESGHFQLVQGDSLLAVLGVNHDRRESDPAPYTSAEWQVVLEEAGWTGATVWEATESTVGALVNRFERGQSHWQWMLAIALCALLCEILLLKPWKKTS
jgi:hypothetical protein